LVIERALFIGAHPDDIEYGCGILIQRCAESIGVVLTHGDIGGDPSDRSKESSASSIILNYELHFFDQKDGFVFPDPLLIERLEKIIIEFNPTLIVTHFHDDSHQDHRACHYIVRAAMRNYYCSLIGFAVPSTIGFAPNLFLNESPEEFEKKNFAINSHLSQLSKPVFMNPIPDESHHIYEVKW